MAKTKKKSAGKTENRVGLSPASQLARNAAAEELLLLIEEPGAEEAAKEEEKEKEKAPAPDAEKDEMRKIIERLMDDMGAESLAALSEMIDRAEEEKLVRVHGLSGEAAALFLAQQEKVRALRAAERTAAREAAYAEMRKDPLYEDVDTYRDAIEMLVLRTGLSAKEAYNALFAEERARRMKEQMAEEVLLSEKKARRIPALSGGDAREESGSVRLSEAEKWAAKRAGLTPTEYARFKYAQ